MESPLDVPAHADAQDRQQLVSAWFEAFQAPLVRYLYRITGDEQLAADLLQDTFVRALAALQRSAVPDNPPAWLHRIATHLAYRALKRRARWRWVPLGRQALSPPFEPAVATAAAVRHCLSRLRRTEVEVLLLSDWVGLSCPEIAALSNERPSAVRMRLSRARARFLALYDHEVAHEL